MKSFSVLMSLYYKEKPDYFKMCMESILSQTILPTQIVIVKDGPLTESLDILLSNYINNNPRLYKIISLEENKGLGYALARGIIECDNELIARMDTDDVAVPNRFEKQLMVFEQSPEIDICGSNILEFENCVENIVAKRLVPENDREIKKYQKYRDGFNHMTVMYKKSIVLKAGNYSSCLLMEDTLLWVKAIQVGAICYNIQEPLVLARVGDDMFERRGGLDYFKKYKQGRKEVLKTGYITAFEYWYTIFIQLIVSSIPLVVRRYIFKKILHN